jgi:Helix-loop-helix DNA-binding domain
MSPDYNFGRVLPESPTFVKEEQEDFGFTQPKFMSSNQQFGNQFSSMDGNGIDPSNLMMNGGMMNNNNNGNFGQSLNHSFSIQDDELYDLVSEDPGTFNNNDMGNNAGFFHQNQPNSAVSMAQPSNVNVYSNTPDAPPISSPFIRGSFNYNQYTMPNGFARVKMERNPSDSRSPMTPKTPALTGLHIGTPESITQNMLNQQLHNQARMTAGQWDGTPGSNQSWMDSPLPSPHHGHQMQHAGIHEVMQGRGSVPAKLDGSHSLPSIVSQEAKKKRRRESHNLVERRRRDNINERIQDLSRLVPAHRLEDEKVRKHLQANGPLSPHGASPPGRGDPATSHLAPGSARRATAGTITTGLPQEEKEKGPNKGDILNGAVAWTRDLMWHNYLLIQQQEQLKDYIQQLGGTWPLTYTDEEHRMVSELTQAVERNGFDNFSYTRGDGSHLRVPGFTNYAGEPLQPGDPAIKAEREDNSDLWFNSNGGESGRNSLSIKEEDDFGMEMS